MATVTVNSETELYQAIQEYGEGDTIVSEGGRGGTSGSIPANTVVDGEGVVVECNRPVYHLLRPDNDNIVIRNVEFRGNKYDEIQENGYWDYPDGDDAWATSSEAIGIFNSDVLVENCTFSGWTHAAVKVGINDGGDFRPTIRNNDIVDNNARALGYGVASYSGHPIIEDNYFNNNRHDIAGGDWEGCGYTARFNHVGPEGRIYGFEMHPPGGRNIRIYQNTFEDKYKTKSPNERATLIRNRGDPSGNAIVKNNWFKGEMTVNVGDGYTFENNHEGSSEPGPAIGAPRDVSPQYPWHDKRNSLQYHIKYPYIGPQSGNVEGYDDRPTEADADYTVSTGDELYDALGSLGTNETIWIDSNAEIDVSGRPYRRDIPSGSTVASDGATLYASTGQNGVFELTNDGARLTGVRFEGHREIGYVDEYTQYIGVLARADVTIDNCEFYDWNLAGVYIGFPSNEGGQVEPHLHHNIFRDTRWDGYGYGAVVYDSANPLFEYNYFCNNRHAIGSGGNPDCEYRARNNLSGIYGRIYNFEMHEDGTDSGQGATIENNEFEMVYNNNGNRARSFTQRGVPRDESVFNNNWTRGNEPDPNDPNTPGAAVVQINHGLSEWRNVSWNNNHYGESEPSDDSIGIQELSVPGDDESPDGSSVMEVAIHDGTNEYRSTQGEDTLSLSDRLSEIARMHSKDMNERDFFSHTNPDGQGAGDRLNEADIEWNSYAENISSRTPASYDPDNAEEIAQDIVDGWINSSGHEENMVGNYTREGIGVHIQDGQIRATQVFHTGPDPDSDITVDISSGQTAIQSALDDAQSGDTVTVTGSGSYTWDQSIEVPNGVTLDVSNDISITVPENHNVTAYSPNGATVYSLITNADRSSAHDVTIRGGEYDLSNMPEIAEYAGIWLHNAENSSIDDVICRGSGQAVYGSSSNRGFNLALTRCTDSRIRDSEGYDAAYDDITVRGGCVDCRVIRSGGSGASSGTIQTARWGRWGLTGYPRGTVFDECWGRRIYDHDGIDTEWINCESSFRLQTIGTDNALIRDSTEYEGYILLYTYDSSSPQSEIRDMDFDPDGSEDYAIRAGANGPDHGTIIVDGATGSRPEFFRVGGYSGGGEIDEIIFRNCDFSGDGSGPIISQESNASDPGMLRVENCTFTDFDEGLTGSYDSVRVTDTAFNNVNGSPIAVDSTDVQTSGVTTDNQVQRELLEVYVENDESGNRIEGAEVTVTWLDGDEGPWTDTSSNDYSGRSDGATVFQNLPVGFYEITVTHPEYEDGSYSSRYWRSYEQDRGALSLTTDNAPRRPIIHLTPRETSDVGTGGNIFRGDTTLYRWSTSRDWQDSTMTNVVEDNGLQLGWNMDEAPWDTHGISFWPLNETGISVGDRIGSSNGTMGSVETGADGPNGMNAMYLNGNEYIEITPDSSHNFSGNFTVAAVVKPDELHRGTIFRNGYTEAGTFFMDVHPDNGVSFGFYDDSGTAIWDSEFVSGVITPGEWHCIIGTYNGSRLRVYVNGEYSDYSTSAFRPTAPNDTIQLGERHTANDRNFIGTISWVGVMSGEISQDEAQSLNDALFEGTITTGEKE